MNQASSIKFDVLVTWLNVELDIYVPLILALGEGYVGSLFENFGVLERAHMQNAAKIVKSACGK